MKLKIADLSGKQLKNYLIASCFISELTHEKLQLILNDYKKAEGRNKEDLNRVLIESNLKTVIAIANRYRGAGISFAGLIAAGNAGLISAVKNFAPGNVDDFMQHISWTIEGAIINALITTKKK